MLSHWRKPTRRPYPRYRYRYRLSGRLPPRDTVCRHALLTLRCAIETDGAAQKGLALSIHPNGNFLHQAAMRAGPAFIAFEAAGVPFAHGPGTTARLGDASARDDEQQATLEKPGSTPWRRALADAGRAAAMIAEADALIIAAGAGMSADSGLPTYEGNGGFWRSHPALAGAGIPFIDIASPAAFHSEARRAWGFYGQCLHTARQTVPHVGYQILRRWTRSKPLGAFVVTSNVDGHFERAGFDPRRIEECHGTLHRLQCLNRCTGTTWPASRLVPAVDIMRGMWQGVLPACPHCGGLARPDVRLFADHDLLRARHLRQARRRQRWLATVRRPVVIEVGAGLHFPTVRRFVQRITGRYAAPLIRINPHHAHTRWAGIGIAVGALDALRVIDTALERHSRSE